MGFLAGSMLWGAALAAVPIVLHLTMRRKPQHWVFPALRFVKERSEQNRRRFRLRHLLLLAARCGFVALLALAMARPLIQASGFFAGGNAPTAAAFVFDASARMELEQQEGSAVVTRLDAAKQLATDLLTELPERSSAYVFDNREAGPAFPLEPPAAKQRIAAIQPSPAAGPLLNAAARAVAVLAEAEQMQRELYVFTDLAATEWDGEATAAWRDRAAEAGVTLYVVDVSAERFADVALGDLAISAEELSRAEAAQITTTVSATGGEFPKRVAVELLVQAGDDDAPQLRGRTEVELTSSDPIPVDLPEISGLSEGLHQVLVRIDSEDDLSVDDARFFTLEVRPAWRVLVAAPAPASTTAYAITQALAPQDLQTTGQAPFLVDVVALSALSEAPLESFDAVILLDPDELQSALWRRLQAFAAGGGGVGVVLGRNASFVAEELNDSAAAGLLPGRLERVWRAGERRWFLAPDDYQHPLLRDFQSIAGETPWDAFPIDKYWQIESDAEAPVRVVLRLSNNAPVAWERTLGSGRVVTFATPIFETNTTPDRWSSLLAGSGEIAPWPGVLLVHRLGHYLVGAADERLNYSVGDTVTLRTPERGAAAAILELPNGDSLRQTVEGGRFVVSSSYNPGHYLLLSGGEEEGWRRGFSVNLPASATDLRKLSEDELAAVLGDLPYQVGRSDADWERGPAGGRGASELYPLLALAAALLFASETWLSNRFYGDRESTPVASAA